MGTGKEVQGIEHHLRIQMLLCSAKPSEQAANGK